MLPSTLNALRRFAVPLSVLLGALMPLQVLAGEFHIQGRVLGENGEPLGNTPVFAVCAGALPEGPAIECGFPNLMGRRGTTDASGRFSLEKLPPALYTVVSAIESGEHAGEASVSIALRANVENVELRLAALHSITGVVLDTTGAPVGDVQVSANADRSAQLSGVAKDHSRGSASTDASGHFVIKNLTDAPYTLEASKRGFLDFKLGGLARPGKTPVTIRLTPCAGVTGQVVDPDGKPVEQLSVGQFKSRLPEGRFEEFYCSTSSGEANLEFTAPGMSLKRIHFTLQKEKLLDLGRIPMERSRVLRIHVTEKGSGKPVPHASLDFDEPIPKYSYSTGEDGWSEIKDHPDQAYELSVHGSGLLPQKVHVSKGQTEVQVELDPGHVLSGRALNSNGQPLFGLLSVICSGKQGGGGSAQLGPEGEFRITGITGGVCSFTLQSGGMPTFEHVRWLWVDPHQQETQVELRDPSGPAHAVHVRFRGEQSPNKAVLLMGDVPSQFEMGAYASQFFLLAVPIQSEMLGYRISSREEGGFRFENLHPGTYTLLAKVGKAVFRAPLTVGNEEETLTVDIPAQLTPLPY